MHIPLTPETEALARRVIWFEPPEQALADPVRFVAYALESATFDDIQAIHAHVGDAGFAYTLAHAPPGIIGPRSWHYWHARAGVHPVPPLPVRQFP